VINCFKGKRDALERGNYKGLKLLDQVMKVMKRVLETIIRTQIDIDSMHTSCQGVARQTLFSYSDRYRKSTSGNKKSIFVDLEKAWKSSPKSFEVGNA